jgi:hypothetical protein
LFIFDSKISDNVLVFEDSGSGGIDNSGSLFISASTIDRNRSGAFGGGGIRNFGTARIEESTVSRNQQVGGIGGGGILNQAAV